MAGPPYSGPAPFPSVDVERVLLGIEGDFLFMRVDFAGAIPTAVVHIAESGETEEQWVRNQGFNVSVNSDGDIQTGGGGEGVSGVDIFFAINFDYGSRVQVYANYGFPTGDLHEPQGRKSRNWAEEALATTMRSFAIASSTWARMSPEASRSRWDRGLRQKASTRRAISSTTTSRSIV
jgi:hypothetical protein